MKRKHGLSPRATRKRPCLNQDSNKKDGQLQMALDCVDVLDREDLFTLLCAAKERYSQMFEVVIENVPSDCWNLVFSFCNKKMLLLVGVVCKNFYELSNKQLVVRFSHLACSSNAFLSKFTSLTKLCVRETPDAEQIGNDSLSLLTNLEELTLSTSRDLRPSLLCLTNLKRLRVKGFKTFDNSFVRQLKHLTSLSVFRMDITTQTCPLPKLRTLQAFSLTGWRVWTNLTKLSVATRSATTDKTLSFLTNLRSLSMDSKKVTDASISKLTNLTSLRVFPGISDACLLSLTLLTKLKVPITVRCLSQLTQLVSLKSLTCSAIETGDLRPLTNLTCLLNIGKRTTAEDLEPLTNLQRLSTADCATIKCVSFLTNLTSLKIRNWTMYGSGFSALTNLTSLKVRRGDIIPSEITELTNLTQLHFTAFEFADKYLRCLPNLLEIERLEGPNTELYPGDLRQTLWDTEE